MIFLLLAAVTFHAQVEPILRKHCQRCHQPGEIGRMPLVTYEQARPWAKAIRQAALTKKMPPWFAESGGPFLNDSRLNAEEIRILDRWAAQGALRGTPAKVQAKPDPPRPRPDFVLTVPKPFEIPPSGDLEYQLVIVPAGLTGARWVTRAEIRPSARDAVHHIVAYIRERSDEWLRGKPPGEYFPTEKPTTADVLAVYTPGQSAFSARPGMAKFIPDGADIVLEFHYTPNGRTRRDQTRIEFVFSDNPPQRRVLTLQLNKIDFRIPPQAANHRESVSGTLPNDALLLSFFPHMHLRGKAAEYALTAPGGGYETLARIAPYDFYWQLRYELATPRTLARGSRLMFTAWFDNSPNNPRNPDPAAEVTYGQQSREEMMIGFFDVAVPAHMDKKSFFLR